MNLSTSSSRPFWPKLVSFCLFVVVIAAFKTLATDGYLQESWHEKSYWARRFQDQHQYDIVFAGDSRTYRGVDVETVLNSHASLTPLRIANKGFSAAGLRPGYLEWAAGTLDPRGKRILVLGVTVQSLSTNPPAKNNIHFEESKRSVLYRLFLFTEKLLNRDSTYSAIRFTRPQRYGPVDVRHESGWVEAQGVEPQVKASSGKNGDGVVVENGVAREDYLEHPVDPVDVDKFVECIAAIEKTGVHVIAFRPPACAETDAREDQKDYVDFEELRGRLESVGADWIPVVDRNSYTTYDSSHLTPKDARRLSEALGQSFANIMKRDRPSQPLGQTQ